MFAFVYTDHVEEGRGSSSAAASLVLTMLEVFLAGLVWISVN